MNVAQYLLEKRPSQLCVFGHFCIYYRKIVTDESNEQKTDTLTH